ncbi:MAG: hydantoinase B/oxoprolinase family protein, partial [Dehalococcoidia bacterium]
SRSPIFAEARDFAVAIFDKDFRLIVQTALPLLAGTLPLAVTSIASAFEGDINEGDIYIHNDPYSGNNHLPDINIIKPNFFRGELLFWSTVKGHAADIGSKGIAGYDPKAETIWEDGLIIPACKLYDRGKSNDAIWKIIAANVKVPGIVEGDLRCEVGAITIGERRIFDLLEKYGPESLYGVIDELIARSEREIRDKIRQIPDGVYPGEKTIDFDGIVRDKPVTTRVDVIKKGDDITVDYSRSDPQTAGFVNSSYANTLSATYSSIFSVLSAMGTEIKVNEGLLRPIKIIAPQGLVVNPRFPAPVTMCTVTMTEAITTSIWNALAKPCPQWVQAGFGEGTQIRAKGFNPRTKRPFVDMNFFLTSAGAGANEGYDGWDEAGPAHTNGQVRKPDVEISELAYPIHILRYEQEADRHGAGQWRGGHGSVYEVEYLVDCQAVTTGQGHIEVSRARGLAGGEGPPLNKAYLRRKDGPTEEIEVHTYYDIKAGDIIEYHIMGGSGFGPPLKREVEKVYDEVREGYLSAGKAREDYGVVIDPDTLQLDSGATGKLRKQMKARKAPGKAKP